MIRKFTPPDLPSSALIPELYGILLARLIAAKKGTINIQQKGTLTQADLLPRPFDVFVLPRLLEGGSKSLFFTP